MTQPTYEAVSVQDRLIEASQIGAGKHTVVVVPGLADLAAEWHTVAAQLARQCRVVTYDRAGYGASAEASDPRTAADIAHELHALLEALDEPGPYVLLGHSFGGYVVRVFAGLYPAEVAGVVLVEASHEDQMARLPGVVTQPIRQLGVLAKWLGRLGRVGLLRPVLATRVVPRLPLARRLTYVVMALVGTLPPDQHARAEAIVKRGQFWRAVARELQSWDVSAGQVRGAVMPDVPVAVLTAGLDEYGPDADGAFATWQKLQQEMQNKFPRGRHLVAPRSGHAVHLQDPSAVVDAVGGVLGDLAPSAT